MAQGAVVLTPNNRLSAALLSNYYTYSNKETVIKPQCIPYTVALQRIYEHLRFNHYDPSHPKLLNETQCRHLWKIIIQESSDIIYSDGLLNAVMEAWKHCEQWQIQPDNPNFSYTPQTQTFQQWWITFRKRIQKLNALSEHQLVPYFIKTHYKLFNAPSVIWVCFDELNPQQLTLQNHLMHQGISQFHYDIDGTTPSPEVFPAENTKEEYQQLVEWLRIKIANNEQRIGVVIPELQQESQSIKRLLAQNFPSTLFNISLGEPLSDYPLVAHALSWLSLENKCTQQQATLLAQSPYIGGAKEEFTQRAQILQDCPLLQLPQCTLNQLKKSVVPQAPQLARLLEGLTHYPASATPQEWISLFQKRLNYLGYPGDYGLNSEQYQCYQRFVALFDEFRQLALISAKFTREEALKALTQLATQTIFQAQKSKAPIQISGLLEASGCEFDSLWVMGLTDHCLPAKTPLSAFIPPKLQHDLNMPHSTAARELQFAKQTLIRLQKGSQSTVFSYPKLQGDRPNLPSALITHYPTYNPCIIESKNPFAAEYTELSESYSIPLQSNELLSGGTALLANQAKCPFKAFAEHRLAAKPIPEMIDGIDNKERGKVIHKIMELLWHRLQKQSNLLFIDSIELEELVEHVIEQTHSESEAAKEEHYQQLQHIERTRLRRLALAALEWEKQRPSFEVAAIEQSYTINLSGLEIKVRVDRLDKVDDKLWVIDYKSTLPTYKPWNEDRPQEPQLLLYALLNEDINTLLFMQIKTGKILCSGLSEQKSELKGVSTLKKEQNWLDTREYWHQQLTHLAEETLAGHCPPQPINTSICAYCDFKNLCRI